MALVLTIGGVDRSGLLASESLQGLDQINARNTCAFSLIDASNLLQFYGGTQITISLDGDPIFGGIVHDATSHTGYFFPVITVWEFNCVDYSAAADRHLVARNYEVLGQTAGSIARDIITKDLAGEGLDMTNVADGPTVVKAIFNYVKASDCFTDLANLAGMVWWVDYSKNFYLKARYDVLAPFNITDASRPFFDLKINVTLDNYRNRQYLRGGTDTSDIRTENFAGDGKRATFTLSLPVASTPTITVNGVAKTVGIYQVDIGVDFYWQKSSTDITQDSAGVLLDSGDTLAVTFRGFFPIITVGENLAEITAQAAIEGSSGIHEEIEDDQSITTSSMATEKANALLRQMGTIPYVLTYATYTRGLRAGQVQTVTLTEEKVSGDFLLQEVSWTYSQAEGRVSYAVKGLSGENMGGWVAFFRDLMASGRDFVVRDNEVLSSLRTDITTMTLTEAFSVATPLDDGSGDPYTGALVTFSSDPLQLQSGLELGVVG